MEPATPPPLEAPRFSLPLAAWITWGIYAALNVALLFLHRHTVDAGEIGEFVGRMVAALLLPGVFALVAFYIGKRSTRAGTWTFFVVFALLVFGELASFVAKFNAQMALSQIHREQQAAVAAGDEKKSTELASRASAQLGALAESASGQEKLAAAGTKAYLDRLVAVKKRYDSALASLPGGDFWRLGNLDAENAIGKQRAAIQAFANANAALAELQDENGGGLRREMEQQGLAPEFVQRTIDGYKRSGGARLGLLTTMRKTDADIAQAMLDLLDLAEKNRGKWKTSAEGKLAFSDEKLRAGYSAVIQRVQAANAEQAKAQAALTAPQK